MRPCDVSQYQLVGLLHITSSTLAHPLVHFVAFLGPSSGTVHAAYHALVLKKASKGPQHHQLILRNITHALK